MGERGMAEGIWTKRSERIKDAALKGGATKAQLAKGARVLRPADARGREIPHCASRPPRPAKPSGTQKARRSESERKSRPAPFRPAKPSVTQKARRGKAGKKASACFVRNDGQEENQSGDKKQSAGLKTRGYKREGRWRGKLAATKGEERCRQGCRRSREGTIRTRSGQ